MEDYMRGFASGVVGSILSHPVDTQRIRVHLGQHPTLNLFKLYRGVTPPLIGVGVEKAVVFGTYNRSLEYTNSHIISGGFAGLLASFWVTPIEKLKINLQSGKPALQNVTTCNIYNGLFSTMAREGPGFAIYFSVYAWLKNNYQTNHGSNLSGPQAFLFGGLSGVTSWLFICPQDRVKTIVQRSDQSYRQVISTLYRTEGIMGFFKGMPWALGRAFPLHGGAFMMNEILRRTE